MAQELDRTAEISRSLPIGLINVKLTQQKMIREKMVIDHLLQVISDYCQQLQGTNMASDNATSLNHAILTARDIEETVSSTAEVVEFNTTERFLSPPLQSILDKFAS